MTARDKFDKLNTHYVKGLTNVNHQKNLDHYARDLVVSYSRYDSDGYNLFLDDLTDSDKFELARLYIECNDRDIGECVHGNDLSIDNDYTCALLAMLKDDCATTRQRFAQITQKNIILYYKKSLQNILDLACDSYLLDINNENGFYSRIDDEHGDVIWGKY
jgi:hypothetical protein